MAHGATDHQKDREKKEAPQEVYRCDSLCKPTNQGRSKGNHQVQASNDQSCADSGSRMSKRASRQHCEKQAQGLMQRKASQEELLRFLRKVPWQDFQSSPSHVRSTIDQHMERSGDTACVMFGMYAQGSFRGVTNTTKECPWMMRVLTSVLHATDPQHCYTSMTISWNAQSEPHRDVFNLVGSENLVVPLKRPQKGGEIWIENSNPHPKRRTLTLECNGHPVLGELRDLQGPVSLNPKKWHATRPWQGDRMVLIGYTLQSHSLLSRNEVLCLRGRGFQFPWKTRSNISRSRETAQPDPVSPSPAPQAPVEDARFSDHQEGTPRQAPPEGRGTTHGVDQDATQGTTPRAGIRRPAADDREGGSHHRQPLQDQTGNQGGAHGAQLGVQRARQLGQAQSHPPAAPHGDKGARHGTQLHGVWEALSMDIQRSPHARSRIHQVVSPDRGRGGRGSLEAQEICAVGADAEPVSKDSDSREHPSANVDNTFTSSQDGRLPSPEVGSNSVQPELGGDQRCGDDSRECMRQRPVQPHSGAPGGDDQAPGVDPEPEREMNQSGQSSRTQDKATAKTEIPANKMGRTKET